MAIASLIFSNKKVDGQFSIFVLVELAWDDAGKRTGSSNHEKTT